MNRMGRVILGILTFPAPLLFIIAGPLGYWHVSRALEQGVRPDPIYSALLFHCIPLVFALLAIYLVHAWKTSRIPAERRRFWLTVLLVLNVFAMPVYWYRFIWRQDSS